MLSLLLLFAVALVIVVIIVANYSGNCVDVVDDIGVAAIFKIFNCLTQNSVAFNTETRAARAS